jgi:hypothetical protein
LTFDTPFPLVNNALKLPLISLISQVKSKRRKVKGEMKTEGRREKDEG